MGLKAGMTRMAARSNRYWALKDAEYYLENWRDTGNTRDLDRAFEILRKTS